MGMKKFKMSVVALVVALLIPSSTFASGWDYLGEESLFSNGDESDVYASTGGDYKICRDPYVGPAGKLKVELWEYDPESYNDYVGTRYIERGKCGYFWGIGKFVDGGNEAEFFAKSKTDSDMHLIFYD
ncbi:hypothetical protein [Metabacillus rhizolycopersici]|uniref:Uncharacterized protein n=1 Tax=Metabacillus rhizolycopersici TaxID=2875709 RepID=A0ABS7UYT6_9BACI|nr:hypothetical protein [Metabacillus rhizolycopersici]MBZ5753409.1 hypothetical protein [Metabacillus rhizolycopersici]